MKPEISIEFFPPQTPEGVDKLRATRAELAQLQPEFFSVTYGAGGSTRERTFSVVKEIAAEGFDAAPHLSCIGSTRESIREILGEYQAAGIRRIVALRGDLPSGMAKAGEFRYANELVEFIRSRSDFCVGVAGYPEGHCEAPSLDEDIRNLKRKIDAGADFIITQLFFDNDDFYRFRERVMKCGVRVPIVPGIFPILNYKQSQRIGSLCAPKLPPALREKIEKYRDKPEEIEKYGIEHAARQSEHLLQNEAAGIHIYSMNRSGPVRRILAELPLDPARRASKKG